MKNDINKESAFEEESYSTTPNPARTAQNRAMVANKEKMTSPKASVPFPDAPYGVDAQRKISSTSPFVVKGILEESKKKLIKGIIDDSREEQIKMGMKEELEHKDITGRDPELTMKIVLAHLRENPSYYTKLASVMKGEGEDTKISAPPTQSEKDEHWGQYDLDRDLGKADYTVSETDNKLDITDAPNPKLKNPAFKVKVDAATPEAALRSSGYNSWKNRDVTRFSKEEKDDAEKILKDLVKELHKQMGQDEEENDEELQEDIDVADNSKINYHNTKDTQSKKEMSPEGASKARLEIQEMIDALTRETENEEEGIKKTPSSIKSRLLSGIEYFLEKYGEGDDTSLSGNLSETGIGGKPISKNFNARKMPSADSNPILKNTLETFLKGYERLAYLGNDLSSEKLHSLFLVANDVSKSKHFNLPLDGSNRLEKVISIDSVAHSLHKEKNKDGSSQYEVLDELANISKSFGERERNTRLIIINDPTKVDKIEKLLNLEVLQKGMLEKSGKFWKLFEKAIREGVNKLSDYEVIALREWVYAKI